MRVSGVISDRLRTAAAGQAEAINWINLQEKRASIIARLHPVTPEEYEKRRKLVKTDSGPLRRKGRISIYHGKGYVIYVFL